MYTRILVPLDGSEYAERALSHVQDVAHAFGARVSLLTVMLRYGPYHPMLERMEEVSREHISGYLKPIEERLRAAGIKVSSHIQSGEPADAIAEFASNASVDLIAMSTYGVGSRGRYFLGSVALALIQIAPCPVTLIRTVEPASLSKGTAQETLGQHLSLTGTG